MDWYPLWNSLRIALISCTAVFFLGIFAAYYIAKLPRTVKGVLDVVLTLPMVLPPTVVGYFLLLLFGAKRPLGIFFLEHFGVKLVMNWYSAIFASIVVAFPLMYRTARGAFESFDETLAWSAQTLGQSNAWIFWRVRMPCCRQGILAGTVLAFARALGEYGATSMIAGYTPGKTATINFYDVDGHDLVDLPGYGYAKVSKAEKGRWSELIEGYYNQDRDFALVVSLIDIRHEPSALDRNMVQFLMDAELPFAIALTKADKLSKQQQMKQRAAIKKALKLPGGVPMVVTSSEKGDGIDELRALINRAIER